MTANIFLAPAIEPQSSKLQGALAGVGPMATETITITLKLFAIYQEALGVSEKRLALPKNTTAGDVLNQLLTEYPALREVACAYSIRREPPVCGC